MMDRIRSETQEPLILVPEIFRKTGGVQRYSLRFIEALDRILEKPVSVISSNDLVDIVPESFLENRSFVGCGDDLSWKRKLKLLRALRSFHKPRVILSTHPNVSPLLALSKLFTKTPYVTVAHGIDAWNPSLAVRGGMKKADLLLPVSRYTASRIREALPHHCPPLEVVPNMVEAETFFPDLPAVPWRERLGLKDNDYALLTVSRLDSSEREKGYDLILEAIPRLIRKDQRIHWIVGGCGNDLPRLQQKARNLGVSSHCHFAGFIEEHELPDLYRSSDLFVLPSRKEGFGIVFLEAAASGLPVIAGNEDGAVDALANGVLGTLIPPHSSDTVAKAIFAQVHRRQRNRREQHDDCVERFGRQAFENHLRKALTPFLSVSQAP